MMNSKILAEDIFRAALKAVIPSALINKHVEYNGTVLSVDEFSVSLQTVNNVYVIGAGKATGAMAAEIEGILGDRITDGHIVVKYGHSVPLKKITTTEAGHPVPDKNGFTATRIIEKIADSAEKGDLVICLLSGGGSALLSDVPENISEDDILKMNELLVKCGADIDSINTVRKHVSGIKGGRLASRVYPATLVTLMLSDVPGDSPDVIASGPTCPDSSTFSDAMQVISYYGLQKELPASVLAYLLMGAEGLIPDSPKQGNKVFEDTHNFLIGNNMSAIKEAAAAARNRGFATVIIDGMMQGDTMQFADVIVKAAADCQGDPSVLKPACLLFGGETTLRVTGSGLGGRNQHLALACAIRIKGTKGITILAAGTDGTDGPTDAAGAIVDGGTCIRAEEDNLSPEEFLERFDSYNFFRLTGCLLKTGPTLTNVMDLAVVIVE
jgi:glycerate-2-kinase